MSKCQLFDLIALLGSVFLPQISLNLALNPSPYYYHQKLFIDLAPCRATKNTAPEKNLHKNFKFVQWLIRIYTKKTAQYFKIMINLQFFRHYIPYSFEYKPSSNTPVHQITNNCHIQMYFGTVWMVWAPKKMLLKKFL